MFGLQRASPHLSKKCKGWKLCKKKRKSKIYGNLLDKEVEKLDDHGCPKNRGLAETDENILICSSFLIGIKTKVHCAECKAKLFGNWTMQHLKLKILDFEKFFRSYVSKSIEMFQSFFRDSLLRNWAYKLDDWSSKAFKVLFFNRLLANQLFEWNFCAVQQDKIYAHHDFEQVSFYKKSRLYIFGWSVRDGEFTICWQMAWKWTIPTKIWFNILFLSTLLATWRCCVEKGWKIQVCWRCNFWFF